MGFVDHGDASQRHHIHFHSTAKVHDGMRFVQFYFGLPIGQ